MANTYGGTILLGIEEVKAEKDWRKRYPIAGLTNAEKLRADFWNMLNDTEKVNLNLLIDEDVEIVKIEGKDIIAIQVPQADYHQKPVLNERYELQIVGHTKNWQLWLEELRKLYGFISSH